MNTEPMNTEPMNTNFLNAPVGVHYHAISPDDNVTSANLLTERRFLDLFDVGIVESLDDLIPRNNPNDDVPPPRWAEDVQQMLLNASLNEGNLNLRLQQALQERDGLSGLEVGGDGATLSERQICYLFEDCYGEGIEDDSLNGLPISLKSRPDFAVWDKMMLSCEGRNNVNYEMEDSVRQSASYALVHLFYWLVKRSFLVKNVFGLAVAGTNCKGMTTGVEFAVVLLRISLPTKIGGKLSLHTYKITQSGPLEDLWIFSDRVCGLDPTKNPKAQFGQGCPALLTMPHTLLLSNENTLTSSWNMIRNGSAALILRINESAGLDFIIEHLNASEAALDDWKDAMEEIEYPCFLKSKNYLANHNPRNWEFYLASMKKRKYSLLRDLKDAYKVQPISTNCGMHILMADMGIAIDQSRSFQELNGPRLASKVYSLMKQTLGCQESCDIVHGDIHTGNVVYDDIRGILRLIDYDEANKNSVTKRTPRTLEQHRIHNDKLLKNPTVFTKNQLISLFWECWILSDTDLPSFLLPLREKYYDAYQDRNRPDATMVNQIYDELCVELEKYMKDHWLGVTVADFAEKALSLSIFSPRKTRTGRLFGSE